MMRRLFTLGGVLTVLALGASSVQADGDKPDKMQQQLACMGACSEQLGSCNKGCPTDYSESAANCVRGCAAKAGRCNQDCLSK